MRRTVGSLLVLAGCSADPQDAGLQHVFDMLDAYDEALARQCATLEACYPGLNSPEDASCWGPTSDDGRRGWGKTNEQGRAQLRACVEKVYAREPDAITVYADCLRDVPDAREECLRTCPADVTPCDDGVTPSDDSCRRAAGIDLEKLATELCAP